MEQFPKTPINLPSVAKNLPVFPDYSSSALSSEGKGALVNKSADELMAESLKTVSPKGAPNLPATAIYTGDRYAYSFPYGDNEEMAAQQQSSFARWRNGFLKMGGTATSTFLAGTAGTLYGLGAMLRDGKFSSFYDNEVNRSLDNFNKKMEDWMPNYYTHAEKDASWYSPANIMTANFWSDKVIKNLGFSIGTIGAGFAWGAALKATGLVAKLTQAGKAMQTAEAVEQAIANAPKAQRFGAVSEALNSMSTKYLKPLAGKALMNAERGIVSATGTFGEASLEALQSSNEFRNKMISEYIAQYGVEPKGADLEEINKYSETVGNFTWSFNVALLSATNYIQLPKILNSSKTAEKRMMNNIIQENVEKGATVAEKVGAKYIQAPSILERIGGKAGSFVDKYLWKPAKLTMAPIEGFEEGAQYAIQTGTQDFFDSAYQNREHTSEFWNNISDVFGNVLTHGVDKVLNSKEGMEQVLIGALSGGIQTSLSPFGDSNIKRRGLTGQGGYQGKNTKLAIDTINKSKNLTQVLKDGVTYANIGINSQIKRQAAIANDNKLAEKDYEKDFALSYIMPRVKYGKGESINQEIDLYQKQASTQEGFDQLKTQGVVIEGETQTQFLARLDGIKKTAEQVSSTYEMLNDKYSVVYDKDGKKRLYSDKVIDQMVYAASKVLDYDNRLLSLSGKLGAKGVNPLSLRSVIENSEGWKNNNPEEILSDAKVDEEIQNAFSALEKSSTNPLVNEEEDKRDVLDFADMLLKRNKFVNEYNDMKSSPEKYAEKELKTPIKEEDEKTSEEKKTIKITTKRGDKNLQTNTPYFVGKPIEFTSDNLFSEAGVYELTIIGENGDGSIKIKDQNGKIRDISKEALAEFNVGEKSELAKNKTANFYYNHRNIVYKYNFGKNWGGEKLGRLRYKDGKLYFVYLNSKGKVVEKQINNSHFIKQEGFSQPRITEEGKVLKTKAQRDAQREFEQENQKNSLSEIKSQAREILTDLFDDLMGRQFTFDTLINKKKSELDNIQKELNKLKEQIENADKPEMVSGKKKLIRFKPSVRKVVSAINRLSVMKDDLELEIKTLEAQKEDVEFTISYVMDYSQNIEELPFEDEDFFNELNNQVIDLEIVTGEIGKNINSMSKTIDVIKSTINSAIDFLSSLVNDFEKRYPKVPLALGQEWIDFLKNNPNFLKQHPEYKDELKQLEEMIAQVEDVDIIANEEKLKELQNNITTLHERLEELGKEKMAKQAILEKFIQFADEQKKQKEEDEKIEKDNQLRKDFLGTMKNSDTVPTINANQKEGWEPSKKKAIEHIWRATIGLFRGKDHQKRANRFGARLPKLENKDNIKGVYITAANQHLLADGLIDFIVDDAKVDIAGGKVIALVMVDDSGDAPVLVNEFGVALSEEEKKNFIEHIIFQVFPLDELKWGEEFGEESMFRKTASDEDVAAVKEYYKNFRERVLKSEELELHEIAASFGIPEYEKDENGENDYSKRNSVESVGLVTEDEFYGSNLIFIPTVNEIVEKGTTVYEVPITGTKSNLGRPFVDTPNGRVPLQNRRHTREEANNILNAIIKLAKNRMADKNGLKSDESKMLFSFLRSVVYWGIPETQEGDRKPDAYNGMYLDVDPKTKKFSLFISGKGRSYTFSPSNLEDNREEILTLLESMYMNINSSMVKKYDEPYDEIINIHPNGTIEKRTWINYQSFLLSETYILKNRNTKENGQKRKNISLTTIMRPVQNEEDTNRKGIYFYTTDNASEVTITNKKKTTKAPAKILTPVGKKTEQKAPVKSTPSPSTGYVWDGKTVNTFVGKNDRKILFTVTPEGVVTLIAGKEQYDEIIADTKINILKAGEFTKEGDDPEVLYIYEEKDLSAKDKQRLTQKAVELVTASLTTSIKSKPKASVVVKTEEKETISETLPEELEYEEDEVDDESEAFVIGEDSTDDALDSFFDERNSPDNNPEFREFFEQETYEIENWEDVEKWLKRNFPNLPVYRVKRLIESTNGKQHWGMFKDGALYIYENAEVGTVYHEVFEAVWKMFTPVEEQERIISEFRNRKGDFTDRVSGIKYAYNSPDVTPTMIKEQLAEEFRDYVRFKKIPNKPEKGRPYILKLFADLVSFIKTFFVGKQAISNTEQLFKNINEGGYASRNEYESQLSFATSGFTSIDEVTNVEDGEFRERKLTDREVYQIIQNMTYLTLVEKIKDDKYLFDDAPIRKGDLYDSLKMKILSNLRDFVLENERRKLEAKKITQEQFDQRNREIRSLGKTIVAEWQSIVDRHGEYLKSYNIEFDENDELQVNDENKIRESDFLEANKIDHIRKANKAIRLLLSTLPETNEKGEIKRNSMGGVTLLPISKVAVTIMNNVHNAINATEMFEKLRMLAETDSDYRTLYRRLTKFGYDEKKALDLTKIENRQGVRLITAFWKTFKKQNPEVLNIYVFENGEVAVGEANLSSAASQMKDVFMNSILVKAKSGSPYLVYDMDTKSFKGGGKVAKLDSLESHVSFLDGIGITFDIKKLKKLKSYEIDKFKETVSAIHTSISKKEGVVTFSGKTLSINNRLLDLGYLQAKIENPDMDSTFFNVNGERTQNYIGTNPASDLFDFISQLNKLNLQSINNKNSYYSYLITDVFSRGSVILQKMFTPKGDRIRNSETDRLLRTVYIGGIDDKGKGKAKQSSKLTQRDRWIQQINLNLKGYFLNLVPGDASMEWAVYLGKLISRSNATKQIEDAFHIFENYFIDEFNLAKENRTIPDVKGRRSGDMRFFLTILGKELHDEVLKYEEAEEAYLKNEAKIKQAIRKFVEQKDKKLFNELVSYNVLKDDDDGWQFTNIDVENDLSYDEAMSVVNLINLNLMIANIELHKLLYSDPYQYTDELKRTKNLNSPAQSIINNSPEMNRLFDKVWNNGFVEGTIGWVNFNREFFRTVSYNDIPSAILSLEGYQKPYKETDGQGIISLQAHKQYKIREGEWTDANELQYRYDMAWEKRHKADSLKKAGKTSEAKSLYDTISLEELAILDAGNPQVKSTYTPVKPIARGSKRNNNEYNDVVLDKYSLYPISYRLLYDIAVNGGNDSSNAISLYEKMQREEIDYVVFESGRKVGVTTNNDVYDKKGEFIDTPFNEASIVNVPFHILSVQSEVPSKETRFVTRGTQITKLATLDFLQADVPIDYDPTKNFDVRYKSWNKLSKEEKKTNSPIYAEIQNNQILLDALTEIGYRELLSSLGIEETKKGYKIVDLSLAAETLREEILKREANDNIIDALENFIKGHSVIEATPAYQQIRNVLYSIADKRVISQKINGGMKVQVASTLLESKRAAITEVNGKPVYISDVLGFYEKDGKQVCQIMVGRWFDSDKSDAELIDYFNNTEEGKKQLSALAGVAFRIPTQNKNSIEAFEIKQFLPREFGDAVIVPSAIVNKAGSDFDIDKLTIYFKNLTTGKNGFPKLVEFLTDENSSSKERYYKWVNSIATSSSVRYVKFLSKSEMKEIRQRIKERLNDINERYKFSVSAIKEQEYEDFITTFIEQKKEIKNEQDEVLEALFRTGLKIFKRLFENQQQAYRDYENTIKDMKGASKTMLYYLLTTQVLEDNPEMSTESKNVLNDMVNNYKDILNVYGLSDEKIATVHDRAIAEFRESKSDLITYVNSQITNERNTFLEQINEETEELKFQEAVEIASISKLMSYESFVTLPIENQNTRKALENSYISSLEYLTKHPLHFDKLTSPNSADEMKELAKEITKLRGKDGFDYVDVGNMLDAVFMSHLRHAFVTGKYAIGIAAVNQTNQANNQRQTVVIDRERLSLLDNEADKFWLDDCSIKFKEFNTIEKNGKKLPTLSFIRNKAGKYISDVIGMFIDGYVDISKGPWIMELGAAPNVSSTWLFLAKLGVPINTIGYFMNQPIIREYLKSIERAGYSYLFMDSFVEDKLSDYDSGKDPFKMRDAFEIPSNTSLRETISKNPKDFSKEEKLNQQLMLLEFVKYAKMAEQLFHVTQGMNIDTANINDPLLIFKKEKQLEKARATVIGDVDEMIENSFISKLLARARDMRNALAELLPSDKGSARNIVEQVLAPHVSLPDKDFVILGKKVVTDLFDYVVQVHGEKNKDIKRILITNGGVAKKVGRWVDKVKKDVNHPMHNNHVVNILQEVVSKKADDTNDPKNLKIKALGNKTFDQNNIIFAFRELKEYLKKTDPSGELFYNDIVLLSILQSGLSNSVISFTSMIPYDDFLKIYNPLLSKLSKLPGLEDFLTVDAFYRNNWSNDDVIPFEKAPLITNKKDGKKYYNPAMEFLPKHIKSEIENKKIPQVLKQDFKERTANNRFIVYTWEKGLELITPEYKKKFAGLSGWKLVKAIKADMRSRGDYSYINKGLFKRVEYDNGAPYETFRIQEIDGEKVEIKQYVFKAINAWGDSYRAKEFYDVDKPSVFDNGFIKPVGADNNTIIALFESKQKSQQSTPSATKTTSSDSTIVLKEGTFKSSEISSGMLEAMGYSPNQIGEILKKICK